MTAHQAIRPVEGAGGGGKGGKPRVAREAPDTLKSTALVRAVIVLSEGEIAGVPAGLTLERCVRLNGVPIENADGSRNFDRVTVALRTGAAEQDHLPGFSQQETTTVKNAIVTAATPVDHVVTDAEVDAVRVIVSVEQLTTQNTKNGDLNGASVEYRIEVQEGAGSFGTVFTDTIAGKTLGGYQRAVRVALPETRPCTVRLVRVTPDSASAAVRDDLYFAAAVNVTDAKLTWPHLAVLGVEVPADEVQGRTPLITADLDWLICWVPTNYDPAARTYDGIWDGTFKRAWTNNPAWCLYTLLRDELFGLGDRIAPEQIDKWAFYQIGVYCDGLVDDGLGGTEPRFLCDGPMNTREAAQAWIARLCAAFRGAFAWTAGGFRPVADMPADPVKVFTNANVVGGSFTYEGVPLSARASAAVVSVRDRADQHRLKPIASWEEPDLIERVGWRQRDVSFPFESRRTGGVRFARWVVETDGRTGETVTFATGGEGAGVTVGDPILIGDRHRVNLRMGGRLAAVGATTVTLDAPVTFDAGAAYVLTTHDDASALVEMPVEAGTGGALTVVPLADPPPAGVAAGHAWILTSDQLAPRRFRVLGAAESGRQIQITAVAEDPTKWARVEQGVTLAQPPAFLLPAVGALPQPGALTIEEFSRPRPGAAPEQAIAVGWPPAGDPRVDRWRVEVRPPGLSWRLAGVVEEPAIDIPLDQGDAGEYGVRVRAEALVGGWESPWRTATHLPVGAVTPLPTPTGVTVSALIGGFRVTADEPADAPGFRRLLAYVGASFEAATLVGAGEPAGFDVTGLAPGVALQVWVTADGWRQPESDPVGPVAVTPRRATADDIADAQLTTAKFAAGLSVPVIYYDATGPALSWPPAAAPWQGSTLIFRESDRKLYRLAGDPLAWTASIDGADIEAGSIVAGKIAAGAIGGDEITADAALLAKLAAEEAWIVSANIGALQVETLNIGDFAVTPEKLAPNAVSRPYTATGTAETATLATVQMDRDGYILAFLTRPMVSGSGVLAGSTTTTRLFIDGVQVTGQSVLRVSAGVAGEALAVLTGQRAVSAGTRLVTTNSTIGNDGGPDAGSVGAYSSWALGVYA